MNLRSFYIVESKIMSDEKLTRKERERVSQREEIMRHALRLFSEKGYHSVTMQQIADESEYAVGTIYNHFENKESLYSSIILGSLKEHIDEVISLLDCEPDFLVCLKRFAEIKYKSFLKDRELVRIFLTATVGSADRNMHLHGELKSMRQRIIGKLTGRFEEAMNEGLLKKGNPEHFALIFEEMTSSLMMNWIITDGDENEMPKAETVTELFLRGVIDPDFY